MRSGSGCLLGGGLVLTAAHLLRRQASQSGATLAGEQPTGEVSVRLIGGEERYAARCLWSRYEGQDRGTDAALLEIIDPAWAPPGLAPVRWGRLEGSAEVRVHAFGFPDATVRSGHAELTPVTGSVHTASGGSSGRPEMVVDGEPERGSRGESLWAGLSGGPVFAAAGGVTGDILVGLVAGDPAEFGSRRLRVIPAAAVLGDSEAAELLTARSGSVATVALPPGAAGQGEVAAYLSALIRWLNADPWPEDARFGGPALTPAGIEQRLRIASGRGRERDLDADELASRCARLVVLGGPGSGKTWLARRTARLSAEAALDGLAAGAGIDEVELPLYTTCARLSAAPPGDSIRRAVVTSALGQLPDLGGPRILAALQALFEERNVPTLLVADSLDEARGADDRIRQADTLPAAWRIVLTTRPGSWNRQLAIGGDDPSRHVGVLQPLRYPEDIDTFITSWFTGRPAWAEALAGQLRARPDLQAAATVPLILAFYCILGGDTPLPSRRADLHGKVIRRMLTGRWRGSSDRDPDPDACQETLRDWAWSAAARNPVSGVGDWADEFPTPRVRYGPDDRNALDHVAVPTGPPDPDTGMTRRRFVHRSIQEHLVAEHIALRMPADDAARELLNHLWFDPDWVHAAPAALAMHPQRDQVLKDLICRVTGGHRLPADLAAIDENWEIRRFLARVAQELGERGWSSEAARMIGRARLDLATSPQDNLREFLHELVPSDWPASNGVVFESLLGRLISRLDTWIDAELARAVAGLAVTAEERAQARKALLHLLASENSTGKAAELAQAVVGLAVTAKERGQARKALLRLLAGRRRDNVAAELAWAVAGLEPDTEERAQARQALLRVLASESFYGFADRLARALAGLAVTAEERAQVRQALLHLLARESLDDIADLLTKALAGLEPTAQERAQARQALLHLLARKSVIGVTGRLTQALAGMEPTAHERAQARQALLRRLVGDCLPGMAPELAQALAGLEPAAQERAQARRRLLRLLAGQDNSRVAIELAKAVPGLEPTAQERAQARQALLRVLASEDFGSMAAELAQALAGLAVTAKERAQVRQALLHLLARRNHGDICAELAQALAGLEPTAQERAQARQALLRVLASEDSEDSEEGGGMAAELAQALAGLAVTAKERAQTRQALLHLLARRNHGDAAVELVQAVAGLEPTAQERAQARQALLGQLAAEDPWPIAAELAQTLAALEPTAEEGAQARQALLGLLADYPAIAPQLAPAFAGLKPSTEERAQARQALLGKMALPASEEYRLTANMLAEAAAGLGPTVADLSGSDSWPFPPAPVLLAAVRQNSRLLAWLDAMPLLCSPLPRPHLHHPLPDYY
jgi:hypothetical protein